MIAQEEVNLTMAKETESSSSDSQEEDRATRLQRLVKEPVSFVVEKKLGSGGQAQVYLASQGELSRDQVNGAQLNITDV